MSNKSIILSCKCCAALATMWVALLIPKVVSAQESSSRPDSVVANVPAGPTAALRDTLSAACAENEKDFARFLTARNRDAISRMTAAARLALMKRFVLLNNAGHATTSVSSTGLKVRCDTPDGASQMQIGAVELQDNLAFLPVELREATDSAGATAISIKIGLVRENGEWKLLSLGLVLLDLPALEAEWDAAEIEPNERGALDALRKLAESIENYRHTYGYLPGSLASLGPSLRGAASADAAGFVDSDLATGMKNGYAFRYVILGASSSGAPAQFEVAASPLNYGRSGRRSFFRDAGGIFHAADRHGGLGGETDPKLP